MKNDIMSAVIEIKEEDSYYQGRNGRNPDFQSKKGADKK